MATVTTEQVYMAEVRLSLDEAAGNLPPVCVCCGELASVYIPKRLVYWPKWTLFLLFVHPFIWVVVAMAFGKRAVFNAPFCRAHKNHWKRTGYWALIFGIVLSLGSGVVVFAAKVELAIWAGFGGMLLALLWIVALIIIDSTSIRPLVITNSEIVLQAVSEEFVQAMQMVDRKRMNWLEEFDLLESDIERSPENSSPSNAIKE